MAKIRVIRLMEYTYASVEAMETDRRHWQVQGDYSPNSSIRIKSVVLPLEVLANEGPGFASILLEQMP